MSGRNVSNPPPRPKLLLGIAVVMALLALMGLLIFFGAWSSV